MALLAQLQQAQRAGQDRVWGQCEAATTIIVEQFVRECFSTAELCGTRCAFSNRPVSILQQMDAIESMSKVDKCKVFLDLLHRKARGALGEAVRVDITTHHGNIGYSGGCLTGPGWAEQSGWSLVKWTDIHLSMDFPKPSAEPPQPTTARSNLNGPCAICLEVAPVVALVPCGHCVCVGCQGKLPQGQGCPVCRGAVAGHQNLFGA